MLENIRDISGEDLEAFNHLKFIKIGCTGDGNNYSLLMGVETGYKGVTVAVPVDDYRAMVKHLDVIDAQLSRLEHIAEVEGVHTDYTPVWEDMNSLNFCGELKGVDISNCRLSNKKEPSLSFDNYIRCGQPKRFNWIKEMK